MFLFCRIATSTCEIYIANFIFLGQFCSNFKTDITLGKLFVYSHTAQNKNHQKCCKRAFFGAD